MKKPVGSKLVQQSVRGKADESRKAKRKTRLIDREAWVAFLDVYGFTADLQRAQAGASLDDLFDRLQRAQADTELRKDTSTHSYRLSDNMFLVAQTDGDHLKAFARVLADVRAAITAHLNQGLPVRGALAFGTILIDKNLLIGTAVARAVSYEKQISAPFVFVPEDELRRGNVLKAAREIIDLPIQRAESNSGLISGMLVAPRSRSAYLAFAHARYKKHRSEGPASVAFSWKIAYDLLRLNQFPAGRPI